jgi:peptidoglycan/LPS O-acetylase OafA/YrhL
VGPSVSSWCFDGTEGMGVSRSYFDNLAGARGTAAAVVLLAHVVQLHFLRFGLDTSLHQVSSIASEYAVVVFFILSGYLITHTLEENIERNGKLRLDIYAAARIARLYPPFLYAIGVSLLAFCVMDFFDLPGRSSPMRLSGDLYAARDIVHLSLGEIKRALLMLQGMLEINGPLWSLYMEAKLYVLFACALALISSGHGIVSQVILAAVFYYVAKAGIELNPGFAGYAAMWLIGALAYYAWNDRVGWRNRVLMCAALIVAAELWHAVADGAALWIVARDVLIAAFISWLLFKRRVRVPAPRRLADCSYSLYATHFPVLLLAQSLLISTGSVSVGAAIGVAILSTAAAAGVALIGGAIEAKKSAVQNGLLLMFERLRRLRVKSS